MKNKHLSLDERFEIEKGLNNNLSFKQIGASIDIGTQNFTHMI